MSIVNRDPRQLEPPPALLRALGVSKRFGGVQALSKVSLTACSGEVMALVGENGAGKSTLVKILTGVHRADEGEIWLADRLMNFARPQDATAAGIAAIHQEPTAFEDLSVAENIFVGALPQRGRLGFVAWGDMRRRARELLEDIGVAIDPSTPMRHLGVAERHLVAIAKALSTNARLFIFDEPTASLSHQEIHHLYGIIERLKQAGKAIVFISHKFDEIFAISDRYTVLRDGFHVEEGQIDATDEASLVRVMVGRTLEQIYPKAVVEIGPPVLEVSGYCHETEFADISFDLRRSEILGFYGLIGAGRTELMEAIFGLTRPSTGRLLLGGREVSISNPAAAMAVGLAYVPEDRQHHGAILSMSIRSNVALPILDQLSRGPFLDHAAETVLANRYRKELTIKSSSSQQRVAELSGGNQQKVVIAKWLAANPRILILDEPTKGIDIGSKAEVHRVIGRLVDEGMSIILVSSELEEVLGIADRIVVMHRGRITGRFDRREATAAAVMSAAAGT